MGGLLTTGYDRRMPDRKLLGIGVIAAVISALCCLTPILAVLLAALGLSAAIGWLDYVLLPALAIAIGIVIYALVRKRPA
jgi:mercuric ion transport protein